jgi:hypothetical protein
VVSSSHDNMIIVWAATGSFHQLAILIGHTYAPAASSSLHVGVVLSQAYTAHDTTRHDTTRGIGVRCSIARSRRTIARSCRPRSIARSRCGSATQRGCPRGRRASRAARPSPSPTSPATRPASSIRPTRPTVNS